MVQNSLSPLASREKVAKNIGSLPQRQRAFRERASQLGIGIGVVVETSGHFPACELTRLKSAKWWRATGIQKLSDSCGFRNGYQFGPPVAESNVLRKRDDVAAVIPEVIAAEAVRLK
jgi:hypothetical protein